MPDIAALSTTDMRVVATMLGIPKSSKRERLAADLVIAYRTRCMLAEYGSESADVHRLADRYKLRHLG